MKPNRRHFLRSTLAATAVLAVAPAMRVARAAETGRALVSFQNYPPSVRLVTSLLTNLQSRYQPDLGTSPVLLPGGSGTVAIDALNKAAPDGATVLIIPSSFVTLVPIINKSARDERAGLLPVAGVGVLQQAFAVGPAVPVEVRTMSDYFHWLAAHPIANTYGVVALGSPTHFVGSELSRLADVPLRVAGYKGNAGLIKDIAGGGVPAGMVLLPSPRGVAGYPGLRLLALTGSLRSPLHPDLPTMKESGFAIDMPEETLGVFLKIGTPEQKVQELKTAVRAVLNLPDVLEAMAEKGMRPMLASDEDYPAAVARERATWTALVAHNSFAS
jgi:tripartite-type tricarboxylate transporter receptor subunit TctC